MSLQLFDNNMALRGGWRIRLDMPLETSGFAEYDGERLELLPLDTNLPVPE